MKKFNWSVIVLAFALLWGPMAFSKSYSDAAVANPRKQVVPTSEEPLVWAQIPVSLIEREARKILLTEGTTITRLDRLDFNPIRRLVNIAGEMTLPPDIVHDMQDIAGAEDIPKQAYSFKISFELPKAELVSKTRFFRMRFVEFKVNDQDMLPAFNIVGNIAAGLMVNTSFMGYMLDEKPEVTINSEDALSTQIKQMIEQKGILFRTDSISFKLDSSKIPQLKAFAELEHLRLWQVRPVLLKGTSDQYALRIEAGIGKPSKNWYKANKARYTSDALSLEEANQAHYSEFSNLKKFMAEINSYKDEVYQSLAFKKLNKREELELKSLSSLLESKARAVLNKKDVLFLADPEKTYFLFRDYAKEHVVSFLSDLNRRHMIDQKVNNGGNKGTGMPFLEKRLSQDSVDHAIRFFKDFEFEGEQMFTQIKAVFAPHLPGIILRGMMNMDVNMLMRIGMEGSGIDFSNIPLRADQRTYGSGIPFELPLRIKMLDDSVIGLDVKSLAIGSGSQRFYIAANSPNAEALVVFAKMAITQTLATTLIEQPFALTEDGEVETEEEPEPAYIRVFQNIHRQIKSYQSFVTDESNFINSMLGIAKIDIEGNPFLLEGKEFVAGKMELFFKKLITYDRETQLIKVKLDPRIASDKILETKNDVQIWNIEPVYDKALANTFLELAVGNKKRSTSYLDMLKKRPDRINSETFTHVEEERKSDLDLRVKLNLTSFEEFINQIFKDAYVTQNKEVEKALRKNESNEFMLVNFIKLNAVSEGKLSMLVNVSRIIKTVKTRWAVNPARWFGSKYKVDVKKQTVQLKGELLLSVKELAKYKNRIKHAPNEIFLGKELISLDIAKVGVNITGDTGIFDKIVNMVAGDIDLKSGLSKKLKVFLMKFAQKYINEEDPDKNGSLEMGGVKINQFVKLFTHKEELLLQLNPNVMGAAFAVRLMPNQVFNGVKLGTLINKERNPYSKKIQDVISFDFMTAGNMGAMDKGELYKIMRDAGSLFKPYLNANSKSELKKLLSTQQLFAMALNNSDLIKMSLRHRLKATLAEYADVSDYVGTDTSVLDAIYAGLPADARLVMAPKGSKRITTTGVELMYFASCAAVLSMQLDRLLSKIEKFGLNTEVAYVKEFEKASIDLKQRYVLELLENYRELGFAENNEKIVEKGPTDWNYVVYPDARYSNSVYQSLKEITK
ncbi:MAG: hypothetical protein HN509_03910 [Halobacteriovoraceae bacterium]|jgi:hypothetical protein|nr:hypothetical protein [Halobacteriovoraceae bacterium]MBT5095765.1 hypothetical protein [Halobacteriovoraceae bacterium]